MSGVIGGWALRTRRSELSASSRWLARADEGFVCVDDKVIVAGLHSNYILGSWLTARDSDALAECLVISCLVSMVASCELVNLTRIAEAQKSFKHCRLPLDPVACVMPSLSREKWSKNTCISTQMISRKCCYVASYSRRRVEQEERKTSEKKCRTKSFFVFWIWSSNKLFSLSHSALLFARLVGF